MNRLLIHDADIVVTMNMKREELPRASVLVQDDVILRVDTALLMDEWIEQDRAHRAPHRIINAQGCVVTPGLVNCHHHLYQTLTRAIGTGEGKVLFDWLKMLYPVWAEMDAEAIHVSTQVGLAELLMSGATTVADHLYLFPNGTRLDDEIAAAQEMGVRFHPTRGSMSLGTSQGGLPPDRVVEKEAHILEDSQRVIETFHDAGPRAMLRIGLAPCSPFSVSGDLMRESARLARSYQRVGLHTHLAETLDEERFCLQKFGMRPLDYAESVEWMGEDVWFAHMVHPSESEIDRLAHHCSGVCHCATSNMILASGIAPVRRMLDRGVRVGLGVDGSASNDGNHMLAEARQAMLLQRVGWPGFESRADRLSAREALELATLGGARVLQRDDIGSLEAGKAADVVAFRVDDLAHAGAMGDPVAALMTCAPAQAWLSVINGKVVVENHTLVGMDIPSLVKRHHIASMGMLRRARLV